MDYNYHTHTRRCSHATGTEEEYVQRAIKGGIKYMGFSDHAPYICANGTETSWRVPFSQAKDYVSDISVLKDKYKDKIEIRVGFEMEYYPEFFNSMVDSVKKVGAEYLILGQHHIYDESCGCPHATVENDSVNDLKEYVLRIVEGMKTGVFSYVAHPDIFNFTGSTSVYCEQMRKICIVAREYKIPLEINFLGIRGGRIYPKEVFWQIAGEEQCPVVFGFDAHDIESAFDGASLSKAEELVRRCNLNYISRPELKLLK